MDAHLDSMQGQAGRLSEAAAAATLIYQSDPPYYNYLFGGGSAMHCLEQLWCLPFGSISHQRFQVWHQAGQVAALAAHYPVADDAQIVREDSEALAQLQSDQASLQQRAAMLDYLFPLLPEEGYYLRTLAVQVALRGQKIGETVMNQVMTQAQASGAQAMHTDVDSGNPRAVRFYQRMGFGLFAQTRVMALEKYDLPASLRMVKPLI